MTMLGSSSAATFSDCFKIALLLLVVAAGVVGLARSEEEDVPAIFIFGDSTVDVGTNNYVASTIAIANMPYNGIDFPYSKATGRFSNGYNTADQIARLLGYHQSPSPYLALIANQSTFRKNILNGVNFASAGSGILESTGFHMFGKVIPMAQQVEQFRLVQKNITEILGPDATSNLLSRSLFIISVGSNDIVDHYHYNKTTIGLQGFTESMKSNYTAHLTNLYLMGARKFGVIGAPPVGCTPALRVQANLTKRGSGCVEELNRHAREFNGMLAGLLRGLGSDLKGMLYSLGDAYNMATNIMQNPLAFGFTNVEEACCGLGPLNGDKPCLVLQSPLPNLCKDRSVYLFWDFYHPTEQACLLAAKTLIAAGPAFVQPMNFRQLVQTNVQ